MTKEKRFNQIVEGITAFKDEAYFNHELNEQMVLLENQFVNVMFNNDHGANAQLRMQDVIERLSSMNKQCNHAADAEFEVFTGYNREFLGYIKKIRAGIRGEKLTMNQLEMLKSDNKLLCNIELSKGDHLTEIDIVVFTKKAIFILEVKNTSKDVILDDKGNYIKLGYNSFVKENFGIKMNEKEYLLKEALMEYGVKTPNIKTLLVFVDNQINVENNNEFIEHCFLPNLPNIIDSYKGEDLYDLDKIEKIITKFQRKEEKQKYKPNFDVKGYINSFANLLSTLEAECGYYTIEEESELTEESKVVNTENQIETKPKINWPLVVTAVLGTVSGFAGGLVFAKASRK